MRYNQANLITENGGVIFLPPWYSGSQGWGNVSRPNVYAESVEGLYPEGAIYREGPRTFVYVSHKATLGGGTKSAGYLMETGSAYKNVSSGMQVAAALATQITVNYGGACALDKYSGGTFGVYGTQYGSRYIEKQYLAGESPLTGYDMYLDLDVGFPVAMATTDNITLLENCFKDADTYVTTDHAPYIGVIMKHLPTADYYSWLQCGGPHGMTFYWGSSEPDSGVMQMTVYAYHGTTQVHPDSTSSILTGGLETASAQIIGYRAGGATSAMTGGQTIWLTIFN